MLKTLPVILAVTGGALLLAGAANPALAQSADEALDPAHMSDQSEAAQDSGSVPAPPSEAASELPTEMAPDDPSMQASFSDTEVESFATAALEIQDLRSDTSLDDAAKQEMVPEVLADAGIDPQTYSAIGEAMQTDPELARRVQLAAANLRGEPEG